VKVLVTGAAGFIGSTLTDRLLADGHDVVGIDDLSTGKPHNLDGAREQAAFRFAQVDITTPEFAAVVFEERPEVILHLAAQVDVRISVANPVFDATLNILGTINVCEAARQAGVRKVVLTSSGGTIYGSPDVLPADEDTPLQPLSPYAIGKVTGELYLAAYKAMYGIDWLSLALGNVYGPRQDPHGEAGVVAIFGTAMLEGRETKIFGDGTSTRDYVYVDDIVEAFVRSMTMGGGRRLNIGTGVATPVRDLHTVVAAACGAADEPVIAAARTGELQSISLDPTAAGEVLDWRPTVEFPDGVKRTVDWLRTTLD
jgi:UDP-glucose 4-epimerase